MKERWPAAWFVCWPEDYLGCNAISTLSSARERASIEEAQKKQFPGKLLQENSEKEKWLSVIYRSFRSPGNNGIISWHAGLTLLPS